MSAGAARAAPDVTNAAVRGGSGGARTSDSQLGHANADARHPATASRQVDCYPVYEFVLPLVARLGPLPWPGTPAWCELSDHDPAKLAAVLRAGVVWALNEDARQDAMVQASQAISAAADWTEFARQSRARRQVYIPRRSS